jgi:hypothetical protein
LKERQVGRCEVATIMPRATLPTVGRARLAHSYSPRVRDQHRIVRNSEVDETGPTPVLDGPFGWLTCEQKHRAQRIAKQIQTDTRLTAEDRMFGEGIGMLAANPSSRQPLGNGGAQLILSPARAELWPLLPPTLHVVDAVMGVDLPRPKLDSMQARARRPLQPGEIGILLSNEKAWRHALANNWEWSLVMEDDATVQHLPGGVAQLLSMLPTLVQAATEASPDWQLLVLSPWGMETFFYVMEPARIPSLHAGNLPSWTRKPQRLGETGFRRVGPTLHAFGWLYRAPLMRALVDAMDALSPPLNPLDVWTWEVMAEHRMLGSAMSPVIVAEREEPEGVIDTRLVRLAEYQQAIVTTRIDHAPGSAASLRGYNDGDAPEAQTDASDLTKQMAQMVGGDANAKALADMMQSMVHMLPPDLQKLAKGFSTERLTSQLDSNLNSAESQSSNSGHTPAIDKYLGSNSGVGGAIAPAKTPLPSQADLAMRTVLVGLLASDIRNTTRLAYLEDCLRSVRAQTVPLRQILLGVSTSVDMYEPVKAALAKAKGAFDTLGCTFRVRLSKTRQSQFEHYHALLPYLEQLDPDTTWLLFSDDDDLWHPRRVESYVMAARSAPLALAAVMCPRCAVNKVSLPSGTAVESIDASRHLLVRESTQGNGADNYWSIATRLWQWRSFFEATPVEELKSIYSDVYFAMFTMPSMHREKERGIRPGASIVHPVGDASNWMYLWRQDHAGNPQHTEQQKGRLMPLVQEGLASYLGQAEVRARFCTEMALVVGKRVSDVAPRVTTESMVAGYLEELVRLEGFLELARVSLRTGAMTIEQVMRSEAKANEDAGDELRKTLYPGESRRRGRRARSAAEVAADVNARLHDGTQAIISAYKAARLEAMAERAFSYQQLTALAVRAGIERALDALGGRFF